ncbi:hypothetical protein [Aquabacter cavernae]|uniref:hypothetical protein n=1 Tax=Aquabacter cavernae TaxID=2496029 RepID=UPI000F8DF44D|nr:hypothetical protein [Aquabacter cavernae]
MVREMLAALASGVVLALAYSALSSLPQTTTLEIAIVVVAWLLSFSVSILVWRFIARRGR